MQKQRSNRQATSRVVLLLFVAMLSVTLVAVSCSSRGGTATRTPASLGEAPAFSLPDQNGVIYTLDPEAGKPTVIVFYMGYF